MNFNSVYGQEFLKKYFQKIIEKNKIPHTLLFAGNTGYGTLSMAWALANELLCSGKVNCEKRIKKIIHPDLHFVFPTVSKKEISKPDSAFFLNQWREFLISNPYGDYHDWLKYLEAENQQGAIRVKDAENIIHKTLVKPYEGDYKIFVIWMAEKMNQETYNKLLKILEEPPEDTKFILIAENPEQILPTVLSRCQIHYFHPISYKTIEDYLIKEKKIASNDARKIAYQSNGDWNLVSKLLSQKPIEEDYKQAFVEWVRMAFLAKKSKKSVIGLINWSEKMAGLGREEQKYFLKFVSEVFRQALMINYGNPQLNYLNFSDTKFELSKLSPYIHGNNIEDIINNIENATSYIERNANSKLIFINLSLLLTKLIHKKEIH